MSPVLLSLKLGQYPSSPLPKSLLSSKLSLKGYVFTYFLRESPGVAHKGLAGLQSYTKEKQFCQHCMDKIKYHLIQRDATLAQGYSAQLWFTTFWVQRYVMGSL